MPRLLLPAPPVDPAAAAAVADVWFSAAAALLLSSSRPSSVARWTRENVADDAEEHRLRRACPPSCSSGVLQQRIGVGGFSGNNNNTDVDRARHRASWGRADGPFLAEGRYAMLRRGGHRKPWPAKLTLVAVDPAAPLRPANTRAMPTRLARGRHHRRRRGIAAESTDK